MVNMVHRELELIQNIFCIMISYEQFDHGEMLCLRNRPTSTKNNDNKYPVDDAKYKLDKK